LVREFVVIYIVAVRGVSLTEAGFLMALQNLVALATYLPVGQMTKKAGLQPFIGVTFVFFALFPLVLANCAGMTLFTLVMGNSFAAFPVIASGVLVPLILRPYGVDPAMAAILTLTAGASGTLMTPMAANFNIVPAALLNMRRQYGVIQFQLPYAVVIWIAHVILLWAMIRFL
jgi:uncharacterized membrane protein